MICLDFSANFTHETHTNTFIDWTPDSNKRDIIARQLTFATQFSRSLKQPDRYVRFKVEGFRGAILKRVPTGYRHIRARKITAELLSADNRVKDET